MFSQILCVAFDAVGTLIYPDPPVAEVYARIGRKYGSELSETEVGDRFREAFHKMYSGRTATDEGLERWKWRMIVNLVFRFHEAEKTENCFEELFEHFGQASSWRCYPDVEATLSELESRSLQLVLASNFDRRAHSICEGLAELAPLKTRVVSSEVGVHKPARGFYRALLEQTGLVPERVLMVGDDWNNDVIGAMESGLKVVYLDRSLAPSNQRIQIARTIHSLTELLELLP